MKKSNFKVVSILTLTVIGMFGFGFALVPIYNSLCKSLGVNGKIVLERSTDVSGGYDINSRLVTVEFVATNNSGIPWSFYPKTHKIKVHLGEIAKLYFYAENKTSNQMTVQAIPSVTPGIAAKYIKKTECFCFTRQTLGGHEAMNMPLLLHVDKDLPKNINTITLAYTLFDVTGLAKN